MKGIKTHGESNSRLYAIWRSMKERCTNPNQAAYIHYGGRGIILCEVWHQYSAFRDWALNNGYDISLTIERVNNDGNYEPSNCEWVTYKVQANNRRCCNYLTFNNVKLTVVQWSEKTGIPRTTITNRIKRGWAIDKTLNTPSENQSVFYEHGGKRLELNEWARLYNIPISTLWARLNVYKMPFAGAISKPIKRRVVIEA